MWARQKKMNPPPKTSRLKLPHEGEKKGMIIDESNFMLFTHITMIPLITGSVSSRRHAAAPQLLQNLVTNRFIQTTPSLLLKNRCFFHNHVFNKAFSCVATCCCTGSSTKLFFLGAFMLYRLKETTPLVEPQKGFL